ncbi:hypothetical protein DPMN_024288 [Dreissena polymorpha]|uniref:Uncharacterized protein n=1 Tax=Dreissena polymorpha TaxID=45954 RepID=A0A9D4RAN2_DREPO|nr:hypothetical protein DPMN_024288 [Dreissena polymorpha]
MLFVVLTDEDSFYKAVVVSCCPGFFLSVQEHHYFVYLYLSIAACIHCTTAFMSCHLETAPRAYHRFISFCKQEAAVVRICCVPAHNAM